MEVLIGLEGRDRDGEAKGELWGAVGGGCGDEREREAKGGRERGEMGKREETKKEVK